MQFTSACCALFVTLSLALPQGPRGPVAKPDPGTRWNHEFRDVTKLVVKVSEGAPVRLRDGKLVGRTGLAELNALLDQSTGISRVFQRSEEELDRERGALLARVPADVEPPADLNHYFHCAFATREQGLTALRALNALTVVETAFPEHTTAVPCEPGDILPVTPSFESQQSYRNQAPTGIDQFRSRTLPGGRGAGIQVIDIESSWRLDHEDIQDLVQTNVIGAHDESLNPNHGVAVIGIMAADWDQWGVSGLVDRVSARVHSHMRLNWASSVNVAAANSNPGDVIVLEVQLSFNGLTSPMESRQDVFDAVRNATLAGIHVVAAAGNGNNNLDSAAYGGIFDRSVRDSGSVIVGATDGTNLVRASFSNFGTRIDANGHGRRVVTTGYGNLFDPSDTRQEYTATFSGTSSATPVVASAVIALAGIAREQLNRLATPAEIRTLLQNHGTDVVGGSIGRRPDLALLVPALGVGDGFSMLADAGIGQTLQTMVRGTPGEFYMVATAFGRGRSTFPGATGDFLLNTANATISASGLLDSAGTGLYSMTVPNQPVLRGLDLYMQALLFSPPSLTFTNSLQNHVP